MYIRKKVLSVMFNLWNVYWRVEGDDCLEVGFGFLEMKMFCEILLVELRFVGGGWWVFFCFEVIGILVNLYYLDSFGCNW